MWLYSEISADAPVGGKSNSKSGKADEVFQVRVTGAAKEQEDVGGPHRPRLQGAFMKPRTQRSLASAEHYLLCTMSASDVPGCRDMLALQAEQRAVPLPRGALFQALRKGFLERAYSPAHAGAQSQRQPSGLFLGNPPWRELPVVRQQQLGKDGESIMNAGESWDLDFFALYRGLLLATEGIEFVAGVELRHSPQREKQAPGATFVAASPAPAGSAFWVELGGTAVRPEVTFPAAPGSCNNGRQNLTAWALADFMLSGG
ncbi:hypothetical protein AK812_SmicGene16490 [Symbiodinium microadriaticum]|uniref:Uncharacterized protein n=1 Tax=Symbiodinium microadriaticum TaxID=2951 RepID=A0A1Q9E046_SYMMI|nr:hypothetical protein AK812_SmicGene16490 [Symbiodinium microadriaticum]